MSNNKRFTYLLTYLFLGARVSTCEERVFYCTVSYDLSLPGIVGLRLAGARTRSHSARVSYITAVPDMTYNVFGGTLNIAQLNSYITG